MKSIPRDKVYYKQYMYIKGGDFGTKFINMIKIAYKLIAKLRSGEKGWIQISCVKTDPLICLNKQLSIKTNLISIPVSSFHF